MCSKTRGAQTTLQVQICISFASSQDLQQLQGQRLLLVAVGWQQPAVAVLPTVVITRCPRHKSPLTSTQPAMPSIPAISSLFDTSYTSLLVRGWLKPEKAQTEGGTDTTHVGGV